MFSRLGLCVGVKFFVMANGIVEFSGGILFGFFLFPICSHQVPNVFLNMLPIAPHILSHVVWPWFYFYFGIINRSINKYP